MVKQRNALILILSCLSLPVLAAEDNKMRDSSTSSIISAIVYALIVAGIFMVVFLYLRPRYPAIYQPKTYRALPASRNTQPLPKGLLNWIPSFLSVPDHEILRINGLDAYSFMWFIALMLRIFVPIWVLSWIVLMPLYAADLPIKSDPDSKGRGKGFNMFTFGNVIEEDQQPQKRSAGVLILHYIFMAWLVFNIHDVMTHFIRLRKEFLTSPEHRNTNQAKTFLVTSVPNQYLSETKIKQLYENLPGGIKRVWINRNLKELPKLVENRDKLANKLEGAVSKLIATAAKKVKKGKVEAVALPEGSEPSQDVADHYVPEKKRPKHRLGKIPCMGEKVDTINYSREELPRMNREIEDIRQNIINDYVTYPPESSAFVLCNTMQGAYTGASFRPVENKSQMDKSYVEVHPDDIVWKNMSFNPYERKLRTCACWGVTWLTVIFWSIPVALVSLFSNVDYMAKDIQFLSWIEQIPAIPLGIIKAVLPTASLALLNSLLPPWLRFNARMSGVPTRNLIELSLMTRFFIFVVVQNFIILTVLSGAQQNLRAFRHDVSDVKKFVKDISVAIPRASAFYLEYVILIGLAASSGMFLQLVPVILYYVKTNFLGSTPRKLWHLRNDFGAPAWGTLYPSTLFITVIALAYMMLQPVINGFASVTFFLLYLAYRYLFLYVYDCKPVKETGGQFFVKAIHYTFVAAYVSLIVVALMYFFNCDDTPWFAAMGVLTIVLGLLVAAYHIYMYVWYEREMQMIPELLASKMNELSTIPLNDGAGALALPEKDEYYANAEQEKQLIPQGPRPLGPESKALALQMEDPGLEEEKQQMREIETMNAFFNPARLKDQMILWYPNDNYGIGRSQMLADYNAGYQSSVDNAFINEKYKIDENADVPPGEKK